MVVFWICACLKVKYVISGTVVTLNWKNNNNVFIQVLIGQLRSYSSPQTKSIEWASNKPIIWANHFDLFILLCLCIFVYVPEGQLILQQDSIQKDNLENINNFNKILKDTFTK